VRSSNRAAAWGGGGPTAGSSSRWPPRSAAATDAPPLPAQTRCTHAQSPPFSSPAVANNANSGHRTVPRQHLPLRHHKINPRGLTRLASQVTTIVVRPETTLHTPLYRHTRAGLGLFACGSASGRWIRIAPGNEGGKKTGNMASELESRAERHLFAWLRTRRQIGTERPRHLAH
jgi:hypothetical protein